MSVKLEIIIDFYHINRNSAVANRLDHQNKVNAFLAPLQPAKVRSVDTVIELAFTSDFLVYRSFIVYEG